MSATIIRNATIVNEGKIFESDVLIKGERIEKIAPKIEVDYACEEIDAEGLYLLPGIIDDQVHFREPGLTHKAEIATESRAAIAGGVTSFMEMPNTKPAALTQELLQQKYDRAAQVSPANYSFFMGGGNDNYDEVMRTDLSKVCGLKLFMGSSTGNMLVDDEKTLRRIFSSFEGLIATHCEDEDTIRKNTAEAKKKYGQFVPFSYHPIIRDENACFLSSSKAIKLANQYGTRLHVLHISTMRELPLFDKHTHYMDRNVTNEVCVHHLWFEAEDYYILGSRIKCNPAIKKRENRRALIEGMLAGSLDVIATDHAPHTWEEKENLYFDAPSGLPLVQHSLQMMFDFFYENVFPLELIVEKMCHAPANIFRIKERGFIREGYYADLVLLNPKKEYHVNKTNLLYKCGWSPLEGTTFHSTVEKTFVNGNLVFDRGTLFDMHRGKRLLFDNHR